MEPVDTVPVLDVPEWDLSIATLQEVRGVRGAETDGQCVPITSTYVYM